MVEQPDAVVAPDSQSVGHCCKIFQYEVVYSLWQVKCLDGVLELMYQNLIIGMYDVKGKRDDGEGACFLFIS